MPCEPAEGAREPGCSCRRLFGASVEFLTWLDDLVAYGIEQPTASRMMWVWNRRQITTRLIGLGFHARHTTVRKGR